MGDLRSAASIVGVGMTRFGNVLETEEIKDDSLQDLMAEAAFEAMDDAGVSPRDIDLCLFSHYQVPTSHVNVPYRVMDWIGTRFKKAISYNTACSTTNTGAGLAATMINGGLADRVLVVSGEILNSAAKFDPTVREPLGPVDVWAHTDYGGDQEYFYQHWYSVGILYGAERLPLRIAVGAPKWSWPISISLPSTPSHPIPNAFKMLSFAEKISA